MKQNHCFPLVMLTLSYTIVSAVLLIGGLYASGMQSELVRIWRLVSSAICLCLGLSLAILPGRHIPESNKKENVK